MEKNITHISFMLFDKKGVHIGHEYHEPNEFGIIQILHSSLRGDFNGERTDKFHVREGYFIPHSYKRLISEYLDL